MNYSQGAPRGHGCGDRKDKAAGSQQTMKLQRVLARGQSEAGRMRMVSLVVGTQAQD